MGRAYPEHPVSGVGVLVWRDDRVLLVRRGRPPREGEWSLPGGVQELGETVFQAAVREVREETGLVIHPAAIVTVVDSIVRDEAGAVQYHYTLTEIMAECADGVPVAADDAAETRWAALHEIDDLIAWPETRRVIRLAASQRGSAFTSTPS